MARAQIGRLVWVTGASGVILLLAGAMGLAPGNDRATADEAPACKAAHVPEVEGLLSNLKIDPPRTHKNMVVFPIRFTGRQAPGDWMTLDDAVAAGCLKVGEKDRATVPEVQMENTGERTVFLMSGEIIKGGKQTRVVKKDTIIEARQKVAVAVFCVERSRWAGGKDFKGSRNMAPASIQDAMKRGAGQGDVWAGVRETSRAVGAESETGSLDEMLESEKVQEGFDAAHKDLGGFSPPDTVGIAVADARTGRVVGLELFGRRDLFERLQGKLVEGYATDLVLANAERAAVKANKITEKDIEAFIRRALAGQSKYEDTPGSGRGIDLVSGTMRGKGVALSENAIHLSVQDLRPSPAPARPIVDDRDPRPRLQR